MRTQTKYEEIILEEIRTLPLPVLPQAVKMLRSLREGVKSVAGRAGRKSVADTERTGFCGVWKDDRPADEIIADITAHRRPAKGPHDVHVRLKDATYANR